MKYLGVMMWPEGNAIFFAGAKTFTSLREARRYGEAELRAIHAEGVDPTRHGGSRLYFRSQIPQ